MTRLLQAMAGAEHGGAEAFFERLALALQRAGIDQHVLIRRNRHRAALLREGGVTVTELPFGGALDMMTHWGFRRAVAGFKPTIALTWMNRATRFCPRGPFVHVGRLGGYYDLKYYQRCGHLIGNTPDIRNWVIAQGWPPANAHYVPNFVSADKAPPVSRKTYSTPPQAPLIFALGRLHANKAFDVLLKALVDVPGAYLWIAGDGPLLGELERLASHLGVMPRVRFLGWRDDVAALHAAADLFVCPSRHEPLGNVVIEAWAQSKPVVACASQGPSQLIKDSKTGLLTPVDNIPALASAMRRLLADPAYAAQLGAGGRAAFEAQFTEAAVVARYLEFFRQVAG
jgi:glycosyltransferase involved in cell wall biosynthesis